MSTEDITVTSQKALDRISKSFQGMIYVRFGTQKNPAIINKTYYYPVNILGDSVANVYGDCRVVALDNSSVEARDNSCVEAMDNSSIKVKDSSYVVAHGNSSVISTNNGYVDARDNSVVLAMGNSSVIAMGNSLVKANGYTSVEARQNSSVVAMDNSSVVATHNSFVEARGNSRVEAEDNSSVEAMGNSMIIDKTENGRRISAKGSARIVRTPRTIDEFIAANDLQSDGNKVKLYKAVRNVAGRYYSDWDYTFEYVIGQEAIADKLTEDATEECGHGIHMAGKAWCLEYGEGWPNMAILELEVEKSTVVVPLYGGGKVRALKATPVREVPLEECGLLGKMIKRRSMNR